MEWFGVLTLCQCCICSLFGCSVQWSVVLSPLNPHYQVEVKCLDVHFNTWVEANENKNKSHPVAEGADEE